MAGLVIPISLDAARFVASLQDVSKRGAEAAQRFASAFTPDLSKQTEKEFSEMVQDANKAGAKIGNELQEGVKGKISGLGGGLKDAFSNLPGAELFTIAGATAAVAAGLYKVIEAGKEFEKSIAELKAITGATPQQLDAMSESAKRLAVQFGGSATENVTVFKTLLSKLGPDIAQSPAALEQMAVAVQTLSKATGDDATKSVEALTTTLLQFGVDLSDPKAAADVMTEAMNILAASAQVGSSEVPQVAEAMRVAGVSAKGAGLSLAETASAIQVLADGSILGAEAGTALRNMMARLQSATGPAEQTLRKMGTSSKELGEILTTQGLEAAMRRFGTGVQNLSSDVDKSNALLEVFGDSAQAAAGVMLARLDKFGEFTAKVKGTNTAFEQAAINMKTFDGQLQRMTATVQVLAIDAFEKIKPVLALIGEVIFQVGGKIGGMFETVGSVLANIYKRIEPIAQFFAGVLVVAVRTALDTLVSAVSAVASVVDRVFGAIASALEPIINVFRNLVDAAGSGGTAFQDFQTIIKALIDIVGDLVANYLGYVVSMFGAIFNIVADLAGAIGGFVAGLFGIKSGAEAAAGGASFLASAISFVKDGVIGLRANIAGTLGAITALKDVIIEVYNAIKSLNFTAIKDALTGAGDKIADGFTKAKESAYNTYTAQKLQNEETEKGLTLQQEINKLKAGASTYSAKELEDLKKQLSDKINLQKDAEKITVEEAQKLQAKLQAISRKSESTATGNLSGEQQINKLRQESAKLTEDQIKKRSESIKEVLQGELDLNKISQADYKRQVEALDAIGNKAKGNADNSKKLDQELEKERQKLAKLTAAAEVAAEEDKYKKKLLQIENERNTATAELTKRIEILQKGGAKEQELAGILIKQRIELERQATAETNKVKAEQQKELDEKTAKNLQESYKKQISQIEEQAKQIEGKDAESERKRLELKIQIIDLETKERIAKYNLSAEEITKINAEQSRKKATLEIELENSLQLARIELIESAAERELELAQFNLDKKRDAELKAAGENVVLRLAIDAKFEEERFRILQEYNAKRVKEAGAVEQSIRAFQTQFAEGFSGAVGQSSQKQKELAEEKKRLNEEEKALADSYKKREIKGKEFQDKTAEIARKRAELEKQIEESKVNYIQAINQGLAKTLEKIAKENAEKAQKAQERFLTFDEQLIKDQEKLKRVQQRKQDAEDKKNEKEAKQARKEEEDIKAQILVDEEAREKAKQDLYASTALAAGAAFAQMVISGENAGKALLGVMFDSLDAMIPLIVAEIIGKSFAANPILGAGISGLAIGIFKGAVAAAKSAAGFKTGGYTGDGDTNETAGIVHKGEFVSTAEVTKRERPLLDYLHKGGKSEDLFSPKFVALPEYSDTAGAIKQQTKQLAEQMHALTESTRKTQQTFTHRTNVGGAVTVDFDSKKAVAQLSKMRYRRLF